MKYLTSVLRLGHRPERDKRMTTHVALTARALGADSVFIENLDAKTKKTLNDVTDRFGGSFSVEPAENKYKIIDEWKGEVVHLTMYGDDIDGFFDDFKLKDPLIVVGSEKVPGKIYEKSDHNIAVGNQPHSEVAALAVFMDRLNERKIPKIKGGKISVLPSQGRKRVVDYSNVPDAGECYRFCVESGMDEPLMEHTMDVLDRTLELYEKWGGDLKLLVAGAMLHDIGRTVTHGVEHGVEGAKIVREQGWHDEIAKIVERHIGGGITKEEAQEQGLLAGDYVPETLEEKLVCFADKTAGGSERYEDMLERTEQAGFHESAERIRELAEEFDH